MTPPPLLAPVGRTLLALLFFAGAQRHFTSEGISHAADLGTPFAGVLVPLSGLLMLAGATSLLLGFKARLGAWALIAFLVPVTLTMHPFWAFAEPVQHHVQLAMFGKNVALLGALLHLAWAGAGPWSLDARRGA
jgi:putative oxidoreductase